MLWRILIVSLSGANGALRLRLWRQLKAAGAVALRDGVYLLPDRPELASIFEGWREEVVAAGGVAHIVAASPQGETVDGEWAALFDRSDEYRSWSGGLQGLLDALPANEGEARRLLRQRRKELDSIAVVDFFAGEPAEQARRQLQAAERQLTRRYSPDEPSPSDGAIQRLSAADYRGRTWATRARPWVDRIASAWLIQRFIDPDARFIWLEKIADCPPAALGFDFDGATFTHVGDRVTFEVLLESFDLATDKGLGRLAGLVHALDVDGESSPEGAGFEAILSGARARLDSDDALLREIGATLDSLYAHFNAAPIR
jgi:hypothetical protein